MYILDPKTADLVFYNAYIVNIWVNSWGLSFTYYGIDLLSKHYNVESKHFQADQGSCLLKFFSYILYQLMHIQKSGVLWIESSLGENMVRNILQMMYWLIFKTLLTNFINRNLLLQTDLNWRRSTSQKTLFLTF